MTGLSFSIWQSVRTTNKVINTPVKQLKKIQLIESMLHQEHVKSCKTKGIRQRKQGEHKRGVFITSSLSYIKCTKFICLEVSPAPPLITSATYSLALGLTNPT